MSKRLKSFHKLFFIVIFSILFSGVIGSSSSPELPEKIAPELEQIEALPRRTKPAELNIEVTKIKSEPLEEVYIDRKNKNIYVDFSKKKEQALKGVRNAEDLEKKYNLVISEKVQSSGEVVGKSHTKTSNNTPVLAYEVVEHQGKKVVKIPYENEPEKFYISIQENGSNQILKIYQIDVKNSIPIEGTSPNNKFKYNIQLSEVIIPKTYVNGGLIVKGGTYKIEQLELFGSDKKTQLLPMLSLGKDPIKYYWTKNSVVNQGGSYFSTETPTKVVLNFGQGDKGSYAYLRLKDNSDKQYVPGYMLLYISGISTSKFNAVARFLENNLTTLECDLMLNISDADIQYVKKIDASTSNKQLLEYTTNSDKSIYLSSGRNNTSNGYIELPVYKYSTAIDDTNITIKNAYPNIFIEKDNTMLIDTYNLKSEIIVEDNESLGFEYSFGNLYMEEVYTYIPNGGLFPLIALGNRFPTNGSGWDGLYNGNGTSIPTEISSREAVVANFKNGPNFIQMLMSFKNINTNGSSVIKRGTPENMIGSYKLNTLESVSGELFGKFQDEAALKSIINNFRNSPEESLTLTPTGSDDQHISFVIGQYTTTKMTIPAADELTNFGENKVQNHRYPNIKIIKTKKSENLNITLKSTFDLFSNIHLASNGSSNPNITIQSEDGKNLYQKSLWYQSFVKYNDSKTLAVTSLGNSDEAILDLKDSTNTKNIKISIKYQDYYPNIKILKLDGAGEYTLNIKHLDPSNLIRRDYNLKIIVPQTYTTPIFKTDYINNEIIVDGRGTIVEGKPIPTESPDIFVTVDQLSTDSKIFPIITINNEEKWKLQGAHTPLNPVNFKGEAQIKVGDKIYTLPVNLKETPYQTPQKFFIYNRGEMTLNNLGVGAYSNLNEDGSKNYVKARFEINIPENIKKEMIEYAKKQSGNKITFAYEGTGNKIHIIKGIQNENPNDKFDILGNNIIKTLDFPKISVIKGDYTNTNKVDLKFLNPIPKTYGDISGTFDIDSNGNKKPNNLLATLNHPESLSVSNMTANWNGYTALNYKHNIKLYINGSYLKDIETDYYGDLKEAIEVKSGNNTYIITKGKNSRFAIGLKEWDFKSKTSPDIIRFDHENQFGRLLSKDSYNISIEKDLDLNIYLDKSNSTLFSNNTFSGAIMTVKSTVSNIKSTNIGGLKLQNYDKSITQTPTDSTGVRIEVPVEEIAIGGSGIVGKLRFEGDRTFITNPNEFSSLRFIVTKGENTIVAGTNYCFYYTLFPGGTWEESSKKGLVRIKSGNTVVKLVEYMYISWQNELPNTFPFLNYSSTLKNLEIKDTDIFSTSTVDFDLQGTVAMNQKIIYSNADQINIFPAIAIGKRSNWQRIADYDNPSDNTGFSPRNDTVTVEYVNNDGPNFNVEAKFRNPIFASGPSQYKQQKTTGELYAIGSYQYANTAERVTTEFTYKLDKNDINSLQTLSRTIPGNKVIISPRNTQDNQIALIHGRQDHIENQIYLPTDATSVLEVDRVRYMSYPNIVIIKDAYVKKSSVEIISSLYNENNGILTFKKSSNPNLPTGMNILEHESGSMIPMTYKHKIRLTLESGQQYGPYETDENGNLDLTPILLEKGLGKANLKLKYIGGETEFSLTGIEGENTIYNINIDHLDPSNDVRRTYILKIDVKKKIVETELGEIDVIISSRYNSAQSNSIIFKEKNIEYPNETIDIKILKGDNPEINKDYTINIISESGEITPIGVNSAKIISLNTNTTQTNDVRISFDRNTDGHLILRPRYWNNSSQSYFILQYTKDNKVIGEYKVNVKCPQVFIALSGELDFGPITQGRTNIKKEEPLKIFYNDKDIKVEYFLDVGEIEVPNNGTDQNILYLDDNKKFKVNLELGEESGQGSRERTLPLIGTILETKDVDVGKYGKTVQLIIKIN